MSAFAKKTKQKNVRLSTQFGACSHMPGHVRVPDGPIWVRTSTLHQDGTVERSVETRRVLSGRIGFRQVSVGSLFWHNRTRRGSMGRWTAPYPCTIDVYEPIRNPTAPYRPSGALLGPDGHPADCWRHRRIPLNRSPPDYKVQFK